MVDAQTYGGTVSATQVEKRHEARANLFDFAGIFFVGIFEFLERARRVDEVARVDANFVGGCGGNEGGVGVEMNVGNEGTCIALAA